MVKQGDIWDIVGDGEDVLEELRKHLKIFEGLTFHPFPNFDKFDQINRKTSPTEKLNEDSCLK